LSALRFLLSRSYLGVLLGSLEVARTLMLTTFERSLRFSSVALATSRAPAGLTPKNVVWKRHPTTLYRYRSGVTPVYPVPLLLVHSLITRPYILDLVPGNSFVEYLLHRGFDVYLIDWGVPTADDARLRLDDYVLDYLPQALDAVRRESEAAELSVLGYCLGGVLVLLYAATHPISPVRNVVALATPVNFDAMGPPGLRGPVAADRQVEIAVDRWVATWGNVPAEVIETSFHLFRMFNPASEFSALRYFTLWENVEDEQYVACFRALDRWAQDHVAFPGETFRQIMKDLVRGNKLIRGGMELSGRNAELRNIRQSFLAIAADSDAVVPLAATDVQLDLISSADKRFLRVPGGHVSLVADSRSRTMLWPEVAQWLAERSSAPTDASSEDRWPRQRRSSIDGTSR
jgi:polyhydroxyalkanoate synthase subunit PhaC